MKTVIRKIIVEHYQQRVMEIFWMVWQKHHADYKERKINKRKKSNEKNLIKYIKRVLSFWWSLVFSFFGSRCWVYLYNKKKNLPTLWTGSSFINLQAISGTRNWHYITSVQLGVSSSRKAVDRQRETAKRKVQNHSVCCSKYCNC